MLSTTNVHDVIEMSIKHIKHDNFRIVRVTMETADGSTIEISAFTAADLRLDVKQVADMTVEAKRAAE